MSATPPTTGATPHQHAVPAAIVLYAPDALLLDRLLAALDRDRRRLILFANGPLAPAVALRLKQLSNAIVLGAPVNLGHGEGLNAVVRQAMAEGFSHVLLLDQDSEPAPDLPERLRARLAAEAGDIAAIGPLLVPPPGEGYRAIRYQWRDARHGAALFLPTSGTLLALDAFARIGEFRADYFIGGIDVEWGLRADHAGYRLLVARDVAMPHRWGTPAEAGSHAVPQILRHTASRNYYYIRNAIACLRLPHARPGWKLHYGANLVLQIVRLLAARRFDRPTRALVASAIGDGFAGRLGPAEAGKIDAAS